MLREISTDAEDPCWETSLACMEHIFNMEISYVCNKELWCFYVSDILVFDLNNWDFRSFWLCNLSKMGKIQLI